MANNNLQPKRVGITITKRQSNKKEKENVENKTNEFQDETKKFLKEFVSLSPITAITKAISNLNKLRSSISDTGDEKELEFMANDFIWNDFFSVNSRTIEFKNFQYKVFNKPKHYLNGEILNIFSFRKITELPDNSLSPVELNRKSYLYSFKTSNSFSDISNSLPLILLSFDGAKCVSSEETSLLHEEFNKLVLEEIDKLYLEINSYYRTSFKEKKPKLELIIDTQLLREVNEAFYNSFGFFLTIKMKQASMQNKFSDLKSDVNAYLERLKLFVDVASPEDGNESYLRLKDIKNKLEELF